MRLAPNAPDEKGAETAGMFPAISPKRHSTIRLPNNKLVKKPQAGAAVQPPVGERAAGQGGACSARGLN